MRGANQATILQVEIQDIQEDKLSVTGPCTWGLYMCRYGRISFTKVAVGYPGRKPSGYPTGGPSSKRHWIS